MLRFSLVGRSSRVGRFFRPLAAAIIIVAVVGPALGVQAPGPVLAATSSSTSGDALMRLTNLDRAAFGLPALTVDPTLASFALDAAYTCPSNAAMTISGRANDMATRNYFSHSIAGCSKADGSLYTSLDIVYLAFGYNTSRGENIAWNTYPTSDATYQAGCDINGANCIGGTATAPLTVVVAEQGFMKSAGHRANILGTYNRFGCGAAYGTTGWYYACVFSLGGPPLAAPTVTYPASTFVPLAPVRLLDTRVGNGLAGPFAAGSPRSFLVAGRGGVPTGAVAVTGNLTVTDANAGGYVTVAPTVTAAPTTSTVNFPRGDTRANGISVPLASNGTLTGDFAGVAGASVQVILDVTGYYLPGTSAARYVPIAPTRIVDTRLAKGIGSRLVAGQPATFQVTGLGGIAGAAVAITGNVTITGQTAPGYVSLTTTATSTPSTSTINFPPGDTRANNVTIPLGSGGTLAAILASGSAGATTELIVDVTGYYQAGTTGATYTPVTPTRILDTRSGLGLPGALAMGSPGVFAVGGLAVVPADALAVTGNVTMTGQTSSGYIALTPIATTQPTVSTLNAPVGDTRANGMAAPLGASGTIAALYAAASGARSALIVDITGYFR